MVSVDLSKKRKQNFSDGDRQAHVAVLLACLTDDLREAIPEDHWSKLSSRVMARIVFLQERSVDSMSIALAAVALAQGQIMATSVLGRVSSLSNLLKSMREHFMIESITDLEQPEVWEEYLIQYEMGNPVYELITNYKALVEQHLSAYVENLSSEQRARIQPYVLPPFPLKSMSKISQSMRMLCDAAAARRKAQIDIIAPLYQVFIALVSHREQAMRQMRDTFREACQLVYHGQAALPYTFEYDGWMPEVSRGASTVADITIVRRQVRMRFTLWDTVTWMQNKHPEDQTVQSLNNYQRRLRRREINHPLFFAEYNGKADDLFWFGDIIESYLLQNLQELPDSVNRSERLQRLERAKAWGNVKGIAVSRPGLLNPSKNLGNWLARLKRRPNELIFDPEAIYLGTLYGAAITTIVLTNGSRVSELVQMSLRRLVYNEVMEVIDDKPTGRTLTVTSQYLLPKGATSDSERKLFPMSEQSLQLLERIAQELCAIHGAIPVVALPAKSPKAELLSPEPFFLQWAADNTHRYGVLQDSDIVTLIRFVLHKLDLYTGRGERIKITTHILRHVVATKARHDYNVPLSIVTMLLLHHRLYPAAAQANGVSMTTAYYSQQDATSQAAIQQGLATIYAFQKRAESLIDTIKTEMPTIEWLSQFDEQTRAIFKRWRTLLPTLFGFCGNPDLCPRGDNHELCLGCRFLQPDPRRLAVAQQWLQFYIELVDLLHQNGTATDVHQAEMQVQELRNLINIMRLLKEAWEQNNIIPLIHLLPAELAKMDGA